MRSGPVQIGGPTPSISGTYSNSHLYNVFFLIEFVSNPEFAPVRSRDGRSGLRAPCRFTYCALGGLHVAMMCKTVRGRE